MRGGGDVVVHEGALDDVEAAFGIHVDPDIEMGKFGIKDGAMMASVDFFDLDVKGPGGHGARPHETVDTVFIASLAVQAVYQLPQRYFSSLENPVVLSVGRIGGGTAHNIIPDTCSFSGTFRTFANEDRIKLRALIESTVTDLCRLYGAECRVNITPNAPPVINDARLGKLIESAVIDLFGENALERLKYPMTASEDFAYYREKCPIYFLRIGVSSGKETSYPLHHAKFNIDEQAIPRAIELMSHALIKYFDK
jgi:amidohydrolase